MDRLNLRQKYKVLRILRYRRNQGKEKQNPDGQPVPMADHKGSETLKEEKEAVLSSSQSPPSSSQPANQSKQHHASSSLLPSTSVYDHLPTTTSRNHLLNLPLELRHRIYHFILQPPCFSDSTTPIPTDPRDPEKKGYVYNSKTWTWHSPFHPPNPTLPLRLTCHQLNSELTRLTNTRTTTTTTASSNIFNTWFADLVVHGWRSDVYESTYQAMGLEASWTQAPCPPSLIGSLYIRLRILQYDLVDPGPPEGQPRWLTTAIVKLARRLGKHGPTFGFDPNERTAGASLHSIGCQPAPSAGPLPVHPGASLPIPSTNNPPSTSNLPSKSTPLPNLHTLTLDLIPNSTLPPSIRQRSNHTLCHAHTLPQHTSRCTHTFEESQRALYASDEAYFWNVGREIDEVIRLGVLKGRVDVLRIRMSGMEEREWVVSGSGDGAGEGGGGGGGGGGGSAESPASPEDYEDEVELSIEAKKWLDRVDWT